jgi:serine/threonine-protein kinase HipA
LLPGEPIVELEIAPLGKVASKAFMIRRFDRTPSGRKLHFEEFNQLFGHPSDDKYDGSYEEMAHFIWSTPSCIPVEAERLFRRVLACLLIGNTDAHLKNFAMMHTPDGLRVAPAYDLLASSLYEDYQIVALALGGAKDLKISAVRPKHIIAFGEACGLRSPAILSIIEELGKRLDAAREAIGGSEIGSSHLRDKLIQNMEKRWNGTCASTGSFLSKRRAKDAKPRD